MLYPPPSSWAEPQNSTFYMKQPKVIGDILADPKMSTANMHMKIYLALKMIWPCLSLSETLKCKASSENHRLEF